MLDKVAIAFERFSLTHSGLGAKLGSKGNMLSHKLNSNTKIGVIIVGLTAPFIWVVAIPIALLDLFVTVYQYICFPIYGIRIVPRWHFVVIDRHELPYLTLLERLNCAYCSYANGVIAYVREVASRTEKRWCPIKHSKITLANREPSTHDPEPTFRSIENGSINQLDIMPHLTRWLLHDLNA